MPARDEKLAERYSKLKSIIDGGGQHRSKQLELPTMATADELMTLIAGVIGEGGGISFWSVSEGGALCVTLYLDREKTKVYAATRDQWLGQLGSLLE